jgi:hypothetical protein
MTSVPEEAGYMTAVAEDVWALERPFRGPSSPPRVSCRLSLLNVS